MNISYKEILKRIRDIGTEEFKGQFKRLREIDLDYNKNLGSFNNLEAEFSRFFSIDRNTWISDNELNIIKTNIPNLTFNKGSIALNIAEDEADNKINMNNLLAEQDEANDSLKKLNILQNDRVEIFERYNKELELAEQRKDDGIILKMRASIFKNDLTKSGKIIIYRELETAQSNYESIKKQLNDGNLIDFLIRDRNKYKLLKLELEENKTKFTKIKVNIKDLERTVKFKSEEIIEELINSYYEENIKNTSAINYIKSNIGKIKINFKDHIKEEIEAIY
jgi:hypothetical protein